MHLETPAMRCNGPAPTHDMLTRAPVLPDKPPMPKSATAACSAASGRLSGRLPLSSH